MGKKLNLFSLKEKISNDIMMSVSAKKPSINNVTILQGLVNTLTLEIADIQLALKIQKEINKELA